VPSGLLSLDKTIRAAIANRADRRQSAPAPIGWRIALLSKVSELKILERQFAASRLAPSARHKRWDKLIASVSSQESNMATKLDKHLKREIDIEGQAFMLTISPEGLKLVPKGKRNGLEIAWKALVSGDAALATALNASLKV